MSCSSSLASEWGNAMRIVLIAVAALFVGAVIGYLSSCRTIRTLRRRLREQRAGNDKTTSETMKRIVWACVINGFAWVWCSYILAALDRVQIAEDLSKVALAEIVVPVAVYAGKSLMENLSKNNHWPDKPGTGTENPEPESDDGAG